MSKVRPEKYIVLCVRLSKSIVSQNTKYETMELYSITDENNK